MATPTIREVVSTATSGANATVTTGAGTAVNDLLVTFFGNDAYAATFMTTPTGTAGTWTFQVLGDPATDGPHLKIWTRFVTAGGAQTVTVAQHDGEEVFNTTFVLTGANTSTPVDGTPAGGSGNTNTTSMVAPSVSPTTADALLLCGVQKGGSGGAATYTPPSGMTERSDITDGTFSSQSTASLVLAASGATGTKTFTATAGANEGYASASITLQGSGGGGGATAIPGRPQFYAPRRRAANW